MLAMQLSSKWKVFLLAETITVNIIYVSNKANIHIPSRVFTWTKISLHEAAALSPPPQNSGQIHCFQRVTMKFSGGWINCKALPNCVVQQLVTSDFLTGLLPEWIQIPGSGQTETATRLFAFLRWCSLSSAYWHGSPCMDWLPRCLGE